MTPRLDPVLQALSARLTQMYGRVGRPSIAPEKLRRALLLQGLYTIRSERLLMEQLDYNLLFRWFEGLSPRHSDYRLQARELITKWDCARPLQQS